MSRSYKCFLSLSCLLVSSVSAFVPSSSRFGVRPAAALYSEKYDNFVSGETKELAIKDSVVGSGDVAKEGSMVKIDYTGRLLSNGNEFISGTYAFKVGEENAALEGLQKGLPGMKVGGKRMLRIPSEMGLGARGSSTGTVPPNADLEYEIELKTVAEGAVSEFLMKQGLGANGRTVGLVVCLAGMAIIPALT